MSSHQAHAPNALNRLHINLHIDLDFLGPRVMYRIFYFSSYLWPRLAHSHSFSALRFETQYLHVYGSMAESQEPLNHATQYILLLLTLSLLLFQLSNIVFSRGRSLLHFTDLNFCFVFAKLRLGHHRLKLKCENSSDVFMYCQTELPQSWCHHRRVWTVRQSCDSSVDGERTQTAKKSVHISTENIRSERIHRSSSTAVRLLMRSLSHTRICQTYCFDLFVVPFRFHLCCARSWWIWHFAFGVTFLAHRQSEQLICAQ